MTPYVANRRVLVVEDEWLIAEQITTALEEAGYEVVGPVGRLGQALALLDGTPIDVAVIDVNVHEDRSFSLAAELSRLAIPFAFLSGYSSGDLPSRFSQTPLLQKPVNAERLRSCVGHLLKTIP